MPARSALFLVLGLPYHPMLHAQKPPQGWSHLTLALDQCVLNQPNSRSFLLGNLTNKLFSTSFIEVLVYQNAGNLSPFVVVTCFHLSHS